MQEVDNIIRILKETQKAIRSEDTGEIKNLSNQTIHSASITQDPDNVMVAVAVYVVGKILERENYRRMDGWDQVYKGITKNLDLAVKSLEKDDLETFRVALGELRQSANKVEGDLRRYIQDIFYKASVNKAFKIYEHGVSSESTAKLLGVSLWDLSSFIGQTSVNESHFNIAVPLKNRIKTAEEFFS